MGFLKHTIEDIDFELKPKLEDETTFVLISELEEKFIDCWSCYKIVSHGDDRIDENEKISPWDYVTQDYSKGKYFNYDAIDQIIGFSNFENFIKGKAQAQYHWHLQDFKTEIQSQNSDAQCKLYLIKFLDQLKLSINTLMELSGNKHQLIVIETYLRSYLKAYEVIINEYDIVFPEFTKSFRNVFVQLCKKFENNFGFVHKLDEFIYRDYQKAFIKNEELLINEGFLNESLLWLKSKNDLVRYYIHLKDKKYFKEGPNKSHLKILTKLEERYHTKLKKQTDPNRIKNLTTKVGYFDFLKAP